MSSENSEGFTKENMSELSFAKRIQALMGDSVPDFVPRGTWNGVEYKHIYLTALIN